MHKQDTQSSLKNLGMKVTPKRIAIIDTLARDLKYLSAEEIWKTLKDRFTKIGLPTVYRNLEDLSQGGLIIKIIHPDRKLYYFYCRNTSHHHHFVCIACRKVQDLGFCGEEQITREVEDTLKGKVVSHLFQVYGLCRECSHASTIST